MGERLPLDRRAKRRTAPGLARHFLVMGLIGAVRAPIPRSARRVTRQSRDVPSREGCVALDAPHPDEANSSESLARPSAPVLVLTCSVLVLGLGVGWTLWKDRHDRSTGSASREVPAAAWPGSPWRNARREVKYVGDEACARCHAEIAETFRHHPMGRSMAPISLAPAVGGDRPVGSNAFEAGSSEFTIQRSGGREIHRETRHDRRGQVLAQVEAEVKYAVGSGNWGISYLVEHDGRLFESPISWYSQKARWDLSPGYERDNLHFDRPIEATCLFCHANHVEPVAQSVNRYEEPLFRGYAIGCERCHGPGELHVRRQELVDERDPTIVNPRHLEPRLREAVCEQCHLLGDHRVDRPGRETFDYRPGLATSDFFAIFGRANEGGKAVGHVEQMRASRCYRESRGGSAASRATTRIRSRAGREDGLLPPAMPGVPRPQGLLAARPRALWRGAGMIAASRATCRGRRAATSCTSRRPTIAS